MYTIHSKRSIRTFLIFIIIKIKYSTHTVVMNENTTPLVIGSYWIDDNLLFTYTITDVDVANNRIYYDCWYTHHRNTRKQSSCRLDRFKNYKTLFTIDEV